MRRIILLLFLISFSSVHAQSMETAYALCGEWLSTHQGLGLGSCYATSGPPYFIVVDGASGAHAASWAYSDYCLDSYKTMNFITHVCYRAPTCTSPAKLILDTTTGYKTCVDSSVTCPDGSTAPTLAQCPTNCTAPKYNLNGVCTDPPDCNANTLGLGGNYFDYATKSCKSGDRTICITQGGVNNFYCPPIQDCKPVGYICTNDPAATAAAAAERANNFSAAKSKADAAAAKAADAAAKAATSAAAAKSEKELAAAKVQAAKDALAAVTGNPNSTSAALSDAVQAYGKALQAQTAAANKSDNSQASAGETAGYSQEASNHDAAVPGSPTSGHAQNEADLAGQAAENAWDSLNDAIVGGGKGSGQQNQDTGGATEATLQKVLDKLTPKGTLGTYSGVGTGAEKGNFDDSISDAQLALDGEKIALQDKMNEIKTGVSTLFVSSIAGGGGALPVIDFGNMKGVSVVLDMNKYSDQFGVVSTAIVAIAWLSAFSIILSR